MTQIGELKVSSSVFLVLSFILIFNYNLVGIFVLVLTFLYVKYGRRHYLCGHVYH